MSVESRTGTSAVPPSMSAAHRWESLSAILHDALGRPPSERASFLDGACPDPAERQEVEALILAHERPGPLDALADEVIKPLLDGRERKRTFAGPPSLERYRLIDRLGAGGMGVVYRARDERLERDVALKFLPPHLSADEAAKKRFLVEARAAASLEHPNICTVHEIGETDDGQLYIVMGCYDGETLDRLIARGPMPVADAVRIGVEVARGLAKAHDRGIVHRDVKPANIMVTADGVVKILDFGIAKLSDLSFTRTGAVVGTIAYMSPEQAFGEAVDRRSDIWALGIVLYEMLAGVRPYRGPGEQALLFSILTQEPEPLSAVRADVPKAVEDVLRRALAKRPADRYASAQEMIVELAAVPSASSPAPALEPQAAAELSAPAPLSDSLLTRAGERRQAAVVVTRIAGYGELVELLAPEEIDQLTLAVRDAAVEAATRHGGIVNHYAADDAVLLFGVAAAHEDDFIRAVRATLELHESVRALGERYAPHARAAIRMRSGVHTGAVVAQRQRSGDRRFRITGTPLDGAARLAGGGEADAILISPECHRVVGPLIESQPAAPLALHGDSEPVVPHRVLRARPLHGHFDLSERGALIPYAGRTREFELLTGHLTAAAGGSGSVVVVIGEAGSGKSRLLHELRAHVDAAGAQLLMGRCDAYGGTTPYLPFVQALAELLTSGDVAPGGAQDALIAGVRAIEPRLEEFLPLYLTLLAIPSDEHPLPRHLQGEHLQSAMLEAIAALLTLQARRQPTVLLLEDWHWADEASRTALEQLSEVVPSYPLLIVVSCRSGSGVEWTSGEHQALVHLGPLGLEDSTAIILAVLGAGAERVSPDLAQQLHDRTSGNPFFLEETCTALRDVGELVVRNGEAVVAGDSGTVHVPDTVQAVIRARLDHLDPEARDALRMASVIGREFARTVLEDVAGTSADVASPLERLLGSGLIQRVSVMPEPRFRFKHVLTQEVAYDTLLEHQRRTLHAAAGEALERRYADRIDEHLERLAHHFSRAGMWDAAVRYGIRAAARAQTLSQFADALVILERVQEWLPQLEDATRRREMLAEVYLRQERLCETMGMRARQLRIVEELIGLLAPHGASAALSEAYLRQGDVFTLLRRFDAADRSLGTALRLSVERGDRAGERNALRSLALLRTHEGRSEEGIERIGQTLEIDEELGEAATAAGDVASLANMLRNMGRHEEALAALQQALEYLEQHDDPTKRCAVMTVMASVHRELGYPEEALRFLKEASDEAIRRRLPILASFSLPAVAHIHLQQGRIEESLRTYAQAVDLSRRARHADGLAQSLRALGEVLFGLERHAEALPHLREAAGLFQQLEDRAAEALMWSRVAAAEESCGDPRLAQSAWETARELHQLLEDATGEVQALEGVARTLRRQGQRDGALAQYRHVLHRAVELGDRERELSVRNTLGIMLWETAEYGEALQHYEHVLRLCRDFGDGIHEGLALNSIGATLFRLSRYDEARTVLEEAAQHNCAQDQPQLEAHSLGVLGSVFLAMGRPSDAREQLEASLTLRRALGDRRGEGWMLEHLARALDGESRRADAESIRSLARVIAEEVNDQQLSLALTNAGHLSPSPPQPHR